ncbi:hypothetical protein U1Q18_048480, partial [Sarracenia purpurea var. burkii]
MNDGRKRDSWISSRTSDLRSCVPDCRRWTPNESHPKQRTLHLRTGRIDGGGIDGLGFLETSRAHIRQHRKGQEL